MGKLTIFAGRPAIGMVRQLAFSVTGTVAATMILAIAQPGFVVHTSNPPPPEMTSGGKFAARIESAYSSESLQPVVAVDAFVAFPVADEAPPAVALQALEPALPPSTEASELTRPPKHVARVEPRHRVAHDLIPPRRPEMIADGDVAVGRVAAEGTPSTLTALGSDVEAVAKDVFRQAASLGGSMLDPNTWAGLLP